MSEFVLQVWIWQCYPIRSGLFIDWMARITGLLEVSNHLSLASKESVGLIHGTQTL